MTNSAGGDAGSAATTGTKPQRTPQPVTPAARRVAGGRRNPSVAGYVPDPIPTWLRVMAGWGWRLLIVAAAVALVFYVLSQVRLLVVAVFIALVFTSVLRPVVNVFARVMWRWLAVLLALLLSIAVVGGLITYVVASVAGQWQDLADQFDNGIQQILDFLNGGPFHLHLTTDNFNDWLDKGRQWITDHSGDIASTAFSQVASVAEVFTCLALAIFCTIFFLARGSEMWTWFLNQTPEPAREPLTLAGGAGWYAFSGYARGTVIIALTDGLLAGIWLTILGIPLAAPLAVLVFVGAFIPLVGAPGAMIIAMIVALATKGVWAALLVGVGIALIGQLEGHVLQPLIMGKQVSLHPVVVALSVTAGTLVGGLLGAIVAVPLVGVTWAVFSRLHTPDPPMTVEESTSEVAGVELDPGEKLPHAGTAPDDDETE
ncbi:AI-2E family transporter [Luteimicrobium subarcticum]|uniref:Putative PurR-regulated permease PerM n=1 Tax=Luteimicrobium subarcticum TaxID=620910 RepID=A0A2M8W3J4_9MICO|nr:AI-2E family transporter [Luteimicrobium subarcticum]PJI85501.1 putative PurR-regulated permease PerM [Luteimicrobium subarcticum]